MHPEGLARAVYTQGDRTHALGVGVGLIEVARYKPRPAVGPEPGDRPRRQGVGGVPGGREGGGGERRGRRRAPTSWRPDSADGRMRGGEGRWKRALCAGLEWVGACEGGRVDAASDGVLCRSWWLLARRAF